PPWPALGENAQAMRLLAQLLFWLSAALIGWTQLGYALALALADRLRTTGQRLSARNSPTPPAREPQGRSAAEPTQNNETLPRVSLVIAAHDEQASIATKVGNARALDYPHELLQVIVACDGCTDATAERARAAGADLVLELPRGGKIRAQDAAVERSDGELLAFSDANALWQPDALRLLVGAFDDPRVGYACGQACFGPSRQRATNQESLYWRYELAVRELESRLSSITAGNGAIYATRRAAYIVVDPIMGHDLSFPFQLVKRGWRAVYVPAARSTEPMVPSIEGELARKRRMMAHTWPIVLRGGMLSPRGYPRGYALMIVSHRLLRYATPFLHLLALLANLGLVVRSPARQTGEARRLQRLYAVTLAAQLALLGGAGLGGAVRTRPLLVARYYVLTTASLALGLWDWLRHGTDASWEAAEGTRPADVCAVAAAPEDATS
ncbi:MAG TPA: glycosyltransferase, partial [Solirubrobacteraceae bacterium]|nr:glycosyltransferase [Solirubrobacteraceae bacterium]